VNPPAVGAARPALKKRLGTISFFALAFGSMIGVGWVTALGGWLGQAGPVGAMLAFLVGGLLILTIGLCYAEVTPMLPVSGGEVAYAYKAYGSSKAFVVGWFLAFGYLSVSAFEAISVGLVLSYLWPAINRWPLYAVGGDTVFGSHLILAVLFTALIAFINYRGVEWAARFQVWLIGIFLAVTAVFIGAGLLTGSLANLQPPFGSASTTGIVGGMAAVLVTAPFWFVGFDTIPQGAEEARAGLPPRLLGRAIVVSIVMAASFYAILILSVSMTGPWIDLVERDLPTARAFEVALGSPLLGRLVLVAAVIGLLTSWNGFFLAGSRVLFALGRGRLIAERCGRTHRHFGTPTVAIGISAVLTIALASLGRGAMVACIDVGSFCIAVAFLGVALSVPRLRKTFPDLPRPYRAPGGRWIPAIAVLGSAFILAVMIVPGSPASLVWPTEWFILIGCCLVGAGFWLGARRERRTIAERTRAGLILGDYAE
jgi:amino acid transporter